MAQHIVVVEYDPKWEDMFNIEAQIIKDILSDNCVEVFHIGSSAVKGLKSKPIIDIMPVVKNLYEVDKLSSEFEKVGYEYLGEFGMEGRRYMRKGGDNRSHQIHIFQESDTSNINRHLAVRDFLRKDENFRLEYGNLKERLAKKYPYDIEKYCDGKDSFVKNLEKIALNWKSNLNK